MNQRVFSKYLPLIKIHKPSVTQAEITPYFDGHDHYVFVVHNGIAFRFPRTEEHGKKDKIQQRFLQEFAKMSPVPVQVFTTYTDKRTGLLYQSYPFIPGVRLSKELAEKIPNGQLMAIASGMGRFLKALHSFPLKKAREIPVEELDPKKYWKWFQEFLEQDRQTLFHYLSQKEQEWIEQKFASYITLSKHFRFEVSVTHSDMLPEHIIVDQQTYTLNGIIDFSPRIADPANDFKYFDRYGEDFLQEVYKQYGKTDETFDQRREFYAANLPVNNLYKAIERNVKDDIEQKLQELSEYIILHSP